MLNVSSEHSFNWRGWVSVLVSVMSNNIKFHWIYRDLLASLRLLFRRLAICCDFWFFMSKKWILEKKGESESLKFKLL